MKLCRVLKAFLLKIDIFGSSEMLRFKGEGKYQTMTGGTITLALIIIFSIVTFQSFISVVNKSTVTATDATYFLEDPTFTNFQISESKYIFGIGVSNYDLNNGLRYFDIGLIGMSYENGRKTSQVYYDLQPCEESQWSRINQVGLKSYHKVQLNKFICPKPSQIMEFGGKFTSQRFKILKIKVSKCKNQTDPSRPCVSDEVIKSVPSYNLNFYFMNAYVNSGNLQPVDYYLEDRNYFPFNINSTVVNNIYFSEHIINTDNSLLPNEKIDSQTILMVKDLAEVKSSAKFQDQYININLRKSPLYLESTRTFVKFDQLFSYMGGLFGFAISFFFILTFYTEISYEIEMGNKLFFYDNSNPLQPNRFNFFTYIGFIFYYLLRKLSIQAPWKKMEQYYDCKEEVSEQLDVGLLMNKITFLEKCMNILFEDHQFRAIYLQQKPTVVKAQILRLNHGLNKILHKNSGIIQKRLQDRSKTQHLIKIETKDNEIDEIPFRSENILYCKNLKQNDQKERSNESLPVDIVEIVREFIFSKIQTESSSQQTQQQQENKKKKQGMADNIESNVDEFLDEVPAKHLAGLKYINTAMSDIKQVEKESKEGILISKRIHERLSSQISKEQFIVLQCLERLSKKKVSEKVQQKISNNEDKNKSSFFGRIISIIEKKDEQEHKKKDNQANGFDIALQTNHRIQRSSDF